VSAVHTPAEEAEINAIQQNMDKNAAMGPDQDHAQALAQQFNIPASEVERLRNDGQGWGEIKIELSMAQHLVKTDPQTYPTFSDALKRVEEERDLGKGWGKISDDLGFKLGPVISEAQQVGRETRMETKESAKDFRRTVKETQKEFKQDMKENQEVVKDAQKEVKEAGRDKL
jgi:gas vesicle protein